MSCDILDISIIGVGSSMSRVWRRAAGSEWAGDFGPQVCTSRVRQQVTSVFGGFACLRCNSGLIFISGGLIFISNGLISSVGVGSHLVGGLVISTSVRGSWVDGRHHQHRGGGAGNQCNWVGKLGAGGCLRQRGHQSHYGLEVFIVIAGSGSRHSSRAIHLRGSTGGS